MPEKPEPQTIDTSLETATDLTALPEAVMEYVRRHNKIVQDKILAGQPVTSKDLEFIGKVKTWAALPPDLKAKNPFIAGMKTAEKFKQVSPDDMREALKRHLDPQQWRILKHMADAKILINPHLRDIKSRVLEIKWIDEHFKFPGDRKIIYDLKDVFGFDDEKLTELPDNLTVRTALIVKNCDGLLRLPNNLFVAESLIAHSCANLETVGNNLHVGADLSLAHCPKLKKLPDNLTVPGTLDINSCKSLMHLPDKLTAGSLWMIDCGNIACLPKSLVVKESIDVSACSSRVKKEARKAGFDVRDNTEAELAWLKKAREHNWPYG